MNPLTVTTRHARVRRGSTALAVLALTATVSACAVGTQAKRPFDNSAPSANEVQIFAQNREFSAATLYAISLGERRKLGVLEGKTETTYTMPWRTPGPMQIEIVLLARGSCLTEEMTVDPGDVLELQIEPENNRTWRCANPRTGAGN